MAQKIKFRRGTATSLAGIIPENGEPCWTTDTKNLSIGDGSTAGGIQISNSLSSNGTTALVTGVLSSGSLAIESDGLNRLHYGDGANRGGITINNGPFVKHDTSTAGRIFPTEPVFWRHPILYAPVKDSTYYNLDAMFQLDIGQVSTGINTPQISFKLEGFQSFLGFATVIQNISSSIGDLSPTGIVHASEIRTTSVSLPGTPSGTLARCICNIKGGGQTQSAGVYQTGRNSVGIQFARNDSAGATMRVRAGCYFQVSEHPVVFGDMRSIVLSSGSTINSGGSMTASAVFINNPSQFLVNYFWRANGSNIVGQSGALPTSGQTTAFTATGFASGTLFSCYFEGTSDYGVSTGQSDPCRQIT